MEEVTKDNFEEKVLKSNEPVLVDFNADWCGPCKMLRPILEKIADENKVKIVSVNIDDQDELADKYEVSSIPCLVVFKDGKEIKREIGLMPEKKILKMAGIE